MVLIRIRNLRKVVTFRYLYKAIHCYQSFGLATFSQIKLFNFLPRLSFISFGSTDPLSKMRGIALFVILSLSILLAAYPSHQSPVSRVECEDVERLVSSEQEQVLSALEQHLPVTFPYGPGKAVTVGTVASVLVSGCDVSIDVHLSVTAGGSQRSGAAVVEATLSLDADTNDICIHNASTNLANLKVPKWFNPILSNLIANYFSDECITIESNRVKRSLCNEVEMYVNMHLAHVLDVLDNHLPITIPISWNKAVVIDGVAFVSVSGCEITIHIDVTIKVLWSPDQSGSIIIEATGSLDVDPNAICIYGPSVTAANLGNLNVPQWFYNLLANTFIPSSYCINF